MLPGNLKNYLPKEPETLYDLNIDLDVISDLIFKELHFHGKCTPRQLGKNLRIKPEIIQKVIADLRQAEMIGMVGGTGLGSDYQYGLYPKGVERAKAIYERDSYLGPAPVSFDEYVRVTKQILEFNKKNYKINMHILQDKFSDYLGYKDVLMQLGQAVCARKAAFVYGFPGNGKTTLCTKAVELLPPMAVPFAVKVGGQLVRIFDPICHRDLEDTDYDGFDKRWVVIEAPLIATGGELTLEDLDVVYNKKYGCFDVPPQVKANGGILLIDDLGRQRCKVEDIINRFIIPLENKVDYLVLGGQRMEVPTDELVLFSTNLDPMKVVDDAFLHRLTYKIKVRNPTVEEYELIWKHYAESLGLRYDPANIETLLSMYKRDKRGLRAVHPRDLLNMVYDRKRFLEIEDASVSNDELEAVYNLYFVSKVTLVEDIQ